MSELTEAPETKATKVTSQQKIEANRRNSLRSTGPKTAEGKNIVRQNALKHGILSRDLVIPGTEDESQFEELHRQIMTELRPVGPIEENLAEEIISCQWRLKRVRRYETGQIRKQQHSALREFFNGHKRNSTEKRLAKLLDAAGEEENRVFDDLVGKATLFKGYIERLKKHRQLSNRLLNHLKHLTSEDPLTTAIVEAYQLDPSKNHAELLARLENKALLLGQCLSQVVNTIPVEIESEVHAAVLPSKDILDSMVRYETTLKRSFYKALHELERLQRQRAGEYVAPPVTLDVEISTEIAKQSQNNISANRTI